MHIDDIKLTDVLCVSDYLEHKVRFKVLANGSMRPVYKIEDAFHGYGVWNGRDPNLWINPHDESTELVPYQNTPRCQWDIDIKTNTTSRYKRGDVDFRTIISAKVSCNGIVVKTIFGRDMSYVLSKAQVFMATMFEEPCPAYFYVSGQYSNPCEVYYHDVKSIAKFTVRSEGIHMDIHPHPDNLNWANDLRSAMSDNEGDLDNLEESLQFEKSINWGDPFSDSRNIRWF